MNEEMLRRIGGDPARVVNPGGPAKWLGWIALAAYLFVFVAFLVFGMVVWFTLDDEPFGQAFTFWLTPLWAELGFLTAVVIARGRGDAVDTVWYLNVFGVVMSVLAIAYSFGFNIVLSLPFVVSCIEGGGSLSTAEQLVCDNEGKIFIALQIISYVTTLVLPLLSLVAHGFSFFDAAAPSVLSTQTFFGAKFPAGGRVHQV